MRERLAGSVELSDQQMAQLEAHYDLLLKWNRVLSLTSIGNPSEIVERHYCESLFAGSLLPSGRLSIGDIGSGAGFPGLPIAILRPECAVALVESHKRKAVFLKEATRSLDNVEVFALRAETLEQEFDWIVSRAVSYGDLAPTLRKLGRNAELLTGAEEPPEHLGFRWVKFIQLPWGKQRFVRIGERV